MNFDAYLIIHTTRVIVVYPNYYLYICIYMYVLTSAFNTFFYILELTRK